jgi:hypothetical protein
MPWTVGFNLENRKDPLAKGTGETVSSNVDRPIRSIRSRRDDEDDGGVFVANGERPGGAMAGKHENSILNTIQRSESTGREWRTWRAHLGQNRRRG